MELSPDNITNLLDQFEYEGEIHVRAMVKTGGYQGERAIQAEKWLAQKTQGRSDESERESRASSSEERDIARSAKNAAWIAAIAAIVAAIAAIIAIFYRPS